MQNVFDIKSDREPQRTLYQCPRWLWLSGTVDLIECVWRSFRALHATGAEKENAEIEALQHSRPTGNSCHSKDLQKPWEGPNHWCVQNTQYTCLWVDGSPSGSKAVDARIVLSAVSLWDITKQGVNCKKLSFHKMQGPDQSAYIYAKSRLQKTAMTEVTSASNQ